MDFKAYDKELPEANTICIPPLPWHNTWSRYTIELHWNSIELRNCSFYNCPSHDSNECKIATFPPPR